MRILIAGGRKLGQECCRWLIERGEQVIGVVPNENETFEVGIPVYKRSDIKELAPDIIFSLYFHKIWKPEEIAIPPMGILNMHMALAEEYRGCYSAAYCILNGEKRTGVTFHYVEPGIDDGDIVSQVKILIEDWMTGKDLQERCINEAIQLFKETFPKLKDGTADRRPQVTTENTHFYKRVFPSQEIDFTKSGEEILRQIRAVTYPPNTPAYFYLGDRRFVIKEDNEL